MHGLVDVEVDQPVGLEALEHPLLGLDLALQLEGAGERQGLKIPQAPAVGGAVQQAAGLRGHAVVEDGVVDAVGDQVLEATLEIGVVVAQADDGDDAGRRGGVRGHPGSRGVRARGLRAAN